MIFAAVDTHTHTRVPYKFVCVRARFTVRICLRPISVVTINLEKNSAAD